MAHQIRDVQRMHSRLTPTIFSLVPQPSKPKALNLSSFADRSPCLFYRLVRKNLVIFRQSQQLLKFRPCPVCEGNDPRLRLGSYGSPPARLVTDCLDVSLRQNNLILLHLKKLQRPHPSLKQDDGSVCYVIQRDCRALSKLSTGVHHVDVQRKDVLINNLPEAAHNALEALGDQ